MVYFQYTGILENYVKKEKLPMRRVILFCAKTSTDTPCVRFMIISGTHSVELAELTYAKKNSTKAFSSFGCLFFKYGYANRLKEKNFFTSLDTGKVKIHSEDKINSSIQRNML